MKPCDKQDTQPITYTNELSTQVPITTEDETSMKGVTSMERNRIDGKTEMELT